MNSYGVHYGVRNIPVFTTWTRSRLGFSRKTLGKYLGLSAKEVYYIEIGRIPSESIVKRLIWLHRASPVLCATSSVISGLNCIIARCFYRASLQILYYKLRLTGRMTKTGQLVLECCV